MVDVSVPQHDRLGHEPSRTRRLCRLEKVSRARCAQRVCLRQVAVPGGCLLQRRELVDNRMERLAVHGPEQRVPVHNIDDDRGSTGLHDTAGPLGRAGDARHLMSGGGQVPHERTAESAGSPGQENLHELLLTWVIRVGSLQQGPIRRPPLVPVAASEDEVGSNSERGGPKWT